MSNAPVVYPMTVTASEISGRLAMKKEALQLLREGMAPREFVEALTAKKLYIAGIDFIAHAMPAREAVWWGCLCLQHACGESLSFIDKAACHAAVVWAFQPTEENRVAAKAPGDAAGPASPAGRLAMAANQTGGNPREPFASAKDVATAVKLASVKVPPAKISETQRLFLELGLRFAEGRFV